MAPDAPAPGAGDPRVRAADKESASDGHILPDTSNDDEGAGLRGAGANTISIGGRNLRYFALLRPLGRSQQPDQPRPDVLV